MERNDKILDSEMQELSDETLKFITGGELTEDQKTRCWTKARQLKMVMTKADFLRSYPAGEEKDYISSIWSEVEAPFINWGLGDDGC